MSETADASSEAELDKPRDHAFTVKSSDPATLRFLKYYVNTVVREQTLQIVGMVIGLVTVAAMFGIPAATGVAVFQHITGSTIYVPTQLLVAFVAAILAGFGVLLAIVIALAAAIYTVEDIDSEDGDQE